MVQKITDGNITFVFRQCFIHQIAEGPINIQPPFINQFHDGEARPQRTFDQAGSYLVKGLDSFIGDNVEVITDAGRAYIQGYRLQKDLPTTTMVPKSVATKSVRGEQKTYNVSTRHYVLNSTPLKETTQVEAITTWRT